MNINEYHKEDAIYCVSLPHPLPVEMIMNGDISFELRAIINGNKKSKFNGPSYCTSSPHSFQVQVFMNDFSSFEQSFTSNKHISYLSILVR